MEHLSIEQKAIQTYQENLLFFQGYDTELFKKISALDLALEKGFYKEKYSLEYKDEGYFDVLELESGRYLYGENSNKYAETAKESVNFKKVDNLFETFYTLNFSEEEGKKIEKQENLIKYGYATVTSLISYSKKYASKEDTTMIKLYKYIFFGVGLGTHLPLIHQKINSNIYFIIEDDLELFRLSLFVTNYKALTEPNNTKIYFSIFDDEQIFNMKVQLFLRDQFVYNHYIKFFSMLHHSEKKLRDIQSIITTLPHLSFNYSAVMLGQLRPLDYLTNEYKFLSLNKVAKLPKEKNSLYKNPVLLIGAGPSLENNIEWLKENYMKFTIVIVSALMSRFEELNIKPDIITHVHGFKEAMPHLEKVKDMSFFDNSIALFSSMSYPKYVEKFKKENVFIFEGTSSHKKNFGMLSSSNIGALSYGLLLYFNIKDMYLLGLDFAMNQETGMTHSQTHSHKRSVHIELKDVGGGMSAKDGIIEVEGNFTEKVFTTALFNGMKAQCNLLSKSFKKEYQNIFNLANGAKIEDAKPLVVESQQIKSLPLLDKKEVKKELYIMFNQNSENFLTDEELDILKERIKYHENIIKILEEHLQTPHYNDINQYHYNLLGTFYSILSDENKEIANNIGNDTDTLITLYLELICGYLFDLINTKEIKNKKKLIKHLNHIAIPQMIRVVRFFKDELEKYFEYFKKEQEC
jgi:hypothetical protein